MSITLNSVITNLNTYLGDSSEDRISATDRYQALTEATTWLLEELGNEHMVNTYSLDFLDTVNYYKVTTGLADLLVGGDLRRPEGSQYRSFTRKSPRELAEEIAQHQLLDPSWAIERRDGDAFLVINYDSKSQAKGLEEFDEVGTWVGSVDATNLTLDNQEFKSGSGCLNFDVDVSLSGSDNATLENTSVGSQDLSAYEDLGSFLFEAYLPDVTYISSYTLKWGTDSSNYFTATAALDINGNAFVNGWNTIRMDWRDATTVGTPDSGAVTYYAFVLNYTASQLDDTDFRLDNLRIANPETLTFHYVSWNVGVDNSGTDISIYTATTDVPFYSGRYDQYRYAVAHKAASILFYSALRLTQQGSVEESEALKALQRYRSNFESNKTREIKSFKVQGVNLRRGNRRR